MKTLKDLIGNHDQILLEIEKDDFQTFLDWAEENGVNWINGEKINPTSDRISNHMGILSNKSLGFVGGHCWFAKETPTKVKFIDIIGD